MSVITKLFIQVSAQLESKKFYIETTADDQPVLRFEGDTTITITHEDLQLIEDCINRYQHQRKQSGFTTGLGQWG